MNKEEAWSQSISIPALLHDIESLLAKPQPGTPPNTICQQVGATYVHHAGLSSFLQIPPLSAPRPPHILRSLGCSACVEVNKLTIVGDTLNFCGKSHLNCSAGGQTFAQSFDIPCVAVNGCQLFGCPNNCSNSGTCDSSGICQCKSGFFGVRPPDLSVLSHSSPPARLLCSP